MSPEVRAQTIAEWNDLGFWYDVTPESGWVIRGSRAGLEKFAALLDRYAADPRNTLLSEHDHFGPYMYLKVVTWSFPEINRDGIYGTLQTLFASPLSFGNVLPLATPVTHLLLLKHFP
jgi:hypothetical protein